VHLDAHPGIDLQLYLFEEEGLYNTISEAACHESTECLQVLLDFKADVNNRGRASGAAPLHAAAEYGRAECISLLLEKNANLDLANQTGDTAFLLAAWQGEIECVKLLIEAKVNVDQQNSKRGSFASIHFGCQQGHAECVRLFIDSKADVELRDQHGNTGLILAAWDGRFECLELMIGAKVNINYLRSTRWFECTQCSSEIWAYGQYLRAARSALRRSC
jgi:ankyrin repeat protein